MDTHPNTDSHASDKTDCLFDIAEDAIYDVSRDGVIESWNPGAERMFAFTAAEAIGQSLELLIPEDRRNEEKDILDRIRQGKRVSHYETVRVAKDGRRVDVFVSVEPRRGPSGEIIGVTKVVRDITHQKKMEAALRESESRFRRTYRYAPIGIAQVALDTGEIIEVNDKLCELTGVSKERLLGRKISEIVHPDDWAIEERLLDDLKNNRIPSYTIEKRYLRPDQSVAWVRVTASKVERPGGWPYRLSVIEDITERKVAELSLQEREERLRAILDTAVDAIITITDRGLIDSVNPAAARLFGYSESEMIGQNVSILMPQPHRSDHDSYLHNYAKTGKASIIGIGRDVTAVRKDGTVFPIHLAISVVRLPGRTLFTAILHDLTNRRKLEQMVLEGIAREQQRIGQDLHDGLGQQLAGLGFYCKSLATRLAAKNLPEADDARRMADLLSQALMQARGLSRGLNPVVTGQNGLMSALDTLARFASETFAVPCHFDCPAPVYVDDVTTATHAYRIAQEAVTNALKHAKPWNVTISLRSDGDRIHLTVDDDGVGIPDALPEHSGIGRQIMKSRTSFINGTMDISRKPIGGTRVSCVFPNPSSSEVSHDGDASSNT